MPLVKAVLRCDIGDSFANQAVRGAFDMQAGHGKESSFEVEVPSLDEDWKIGVIVGPSGSGKSTIAEKAFGHKPTMAHVWPADKSIVDVLGDHGVSNATKTLTSVGFGSPPAWLRPYHRLSRGEQFRCDLARSILDAGDLVVFDEFTSMVDRHVAKVGSLAAAKMIRNTPKKRLVAVTCHYDIVPWLSADWVVDMATCTLARGQLCRPPIRITIRRCHHKLWNFFRRYHYLSQERPRSVTCLAGYADGQLCAFVAASGNFKKGGLRLARIVVFPDYQGIGIGTAVRDMAARYFLADGRDVSITTSHPAMLESLKKSDSWKLNYIKRGRRPATDGRDIVPGYRRFTASFKFIEKGKVNGAT